MFKIIKKINDSKVFFWSINIIAFGVMFIFSHQSKLYSDDLNIFRYTENYSGGLLFKAVTFAKDYYYNWGGRCLAAFFRVIFTLTDKIFFDITNSLIYVLFCNIVYKFAFPNEKRVHSGILMFIYCILWFTIPTFGQETLWVTGSIAYLWIGCSLFFYLYLLYKRFVDPDDTSKITTNTIKCIVYSILMLLLGFLAGITSEPSACMLVLTCFMWITYMLKTKRKIAVWEWVGMAGAVLGFIFLFTAPGIYARGDVVTTQENIIKQYLYRFIRQTYYSGKYLTIPIMFSLLPTFISLKCSSVEEYIIQEIDQIVMILMALINAYVIIFSPGSSVRVYYVSVILIVASACISIRKHIIGKYTAMASAFIIMFALLTSLSQVTAFISCQKTGEPLEMQMDYTAYEDVGNLF